MKTTSLVGIVICGGKSIRMGTDKGLLLKDGQTWSELAYCKILTLNLPVKISINATQTEAYQKIFTRDVLIEDNIRIPGPLAGLLTMHKEFPNEDFLLLACDMTDIKVSTIQSLIKIYNEKKEVYDFFVFKNAEEYEPLLGIYSKNGLQKIKHLHNANKLTRFSMKHVLQLSNTFPITIEERQKKEFNNYNERIDL